MISGKLDITIKINELPHSKKVQNNWSQFDINCDGIVFTITVRPKIWNKLEKASKEYPQWVAAIQGKLGNKTERGFILNEPGMQIFERKPKEKKETKEAPES